MSPGYIPKDFTAHGICKECKGWDMGGIGVVHHRRDCSRNPDREYFDRLDRELREDQERRRG